MIYLHFRIKLRAWKITFGTIEDSREITDLIALLLKKTVSLLSEQMTLANNLVSLESPITLYNDRGVFIELTSEGDHRRLNGETP